MSASTPASGDKPVIAWTQEELDAHEARGGAWGGMMGQPVPGIDYGSLPSTLRPMPTSRDWNKYFPPDDDEDD
ncbi:MAG: hypothetical protein U1D68_10640 [Arthrobacter sp.]|nr:hypothetical protein [Arthrobacter sp.]MDZ4351360.1 hypothetical protein [Arthrobacter sp.]